MTNRRGSPTLVEVYDRIPVSEDEDIEVRVPKTATPPTERDADGRPGVVVWRDTLGTGESLDIKHQYTVSYPADKRIRKDDRF